MIPFICGQDDLCTIIIDQISELFFFTAKKKIKKESIYTGAGDETTLCTAYDTLIYFVIY